MMIRTGAVIDFVLVSHDFSERHRTSDQYWRERRDVETTTVFASEVLMVKFAIFATLHVRPVRFGRYLSRFWYICGKDSVFMCAIITQVTAL